MSELGKKSVDEDLVGAELLVVRAHIPPPKTASHFFTASFI